MKRLLLLLSACLALAADAAFLRPAPAAAGPRLYLGFLDDQAFRWQPNRQANLDLARDGGTSVIRTIVDWAKIAPRRPRRAADAFAREYRLNDLDELVRNATQRRIEVLLTIWGTPAWANGGAGPNVAPRRANDLRDFAHALASRYSGRYPGFPFVRFFSIWNEPNSARFLAPQFDATGRPVAPRVYASLVAAAYAGIKAASPGALVAAGETAPRGRDRHVPTLQDSESPARFASLVAAAAPGLRFDAWAHHPYPRSDLERPDAPQPWPSVGLAELSSFETRLAGLFERRSVPLWLTEFAYRTSPPDPRGATYALQASYLRQALALAHAEPAVEMFVWFGFRDEPGEPWQSGLVDRRGRAKPALASFAAAGLQFRPTIEPLVQQGVKLTGSGEIGPAGLGGGVLSADGSTALVGASGDDGGAGAAWLFTRSGSTWAQQGSKLTVSGETGAHLVGRSVALSADGRTALIGGLDDRGDAGAEWVFTRTASDWLQGPKLTGSDEAGAGAFGVRAALSADGRTALIGGHDDNGSVGAAWVFTSAGSTWTQQGAKLTASDENGAGRFGVRVALSADGNTALIGGWSDRGRIGAAWVFTRTGVTWTQQGPALRPNDETGAGTFGTAVALSADGNTALIGADNDNANAGAVWVFVRSGSTWTQQGPKLTAPGETGAGSFGKSVALSADGGVALIGGHSDNAGAGAAWVFARSGATWIQQGSKLTGAGESGPGSFGDRVALSADGTTALISGSTDDGNVGAAWGFVSPVAGGSGGRAALRSKPG